MPEPALPRSLGEYESVRVVGRGGMGVVLEVRSRTTGASHAAKLLLRGGSPQARDRFRREAQLLARCDRHPGIVKIHSFGELADGSLYLIMDLVRGEGLDRVLERERKLPARRVAELGRAVAVALGHAHGMGVVHRDVKPSNILLEASGEPLLGDFGLATAYDLEQLTKTGTFLGTLRYCAPEQVARAAAVGPPTDVFSLGCVLHEAIAGSPPLGSGEEAPVTLLARLVRPDPFPDVRTLEPGCPAGLAAIVARAIDKRPEARPANGAELAADLDRFLRGLPISREPSASRGAGGWPRGRRGALGTAVAMGLVAGALLVARGIESARARGRVAEVREVVAKARDLGRALKPGNRAAASAAFAESRAARARALALRDEGVSGAGELAPEADAAVAVAATALADTLLAQDPARALEALEVAPGSLAVEGRLLRARALLVVGKPDAAAAETAAVVSLGAPASRRGEALELLGDAWAAQGDLAQAKLAYTGALAAAPRNDLRVKRGSAAAGAGDDATALGDLQALVPDLGLLAHERAGNARLAGFAPAVYRRALAGEDARDLEAAWRLAPPPPALGPAVALRWQALADAATARWSREVIVDQSESAMLLGRGVVRLYSRVREADPTGVSSDRLAGSLEVLFVWSHNASPEVAERVFAAYLQDYPDAPALLFGLARAVAEQRRYDEAVRLYRETIDHLALPRRNERVEIRRLSFEIGRYYAGLLGETGRDPDEVRLARVAAHDDPADVAIFRAVYLLERGAPAAAFETLEGLPTHPPGDPVEHDAFAEGQRLRALTLDGRPEEAVARAGGVQGSLEEVLWICEVFDRAIQREGPSVRTLRLLGLARAALGELTEAEGALVRLRELGDASAVADVERAIERARVSGAKPAK